jgi:hypothetical protein
MNLALDHLADNPIIDELVCWPPSTRRIRRVRAANVMFRKPFIEVEYEDGEVFHRHFTRDSFANDWAEAWIILDTLTTIELISDFDFEPVTEPEKLAQQVLQTRDECIAESDLMFEQGMYDQFLMQYGEDCKNLPAQALQRIAEARERLGSAR